MRMRVRVRVCIRVCLSERIHARTDACVRASAAHVRTCMRVRGRGDARRAVDARGSRMPS